MDLQLFISNELAIHFYYSRDSVEGDIFHVKNLCLVFPGLPNTIDKSYFSDRVSRDTAFLSVSYYGTWMSGGNFNPQSVKQTIQDAISFAKSKEGVKAFDNEKMCWEYENLFVVGYSFAGNFVLNSVLDKDSITSIILCAPLIYVDKQIVETVLGNDASDFFDSNMFFLQFLQRGYPYVLRGIEDHSWASYFDGSYDLSKISIPENYPPIHVIHGTEDTQVNFKFSEYFNSQYPTISTLELQKGVGHTKEMFQSRHLRV
ncbi:MAG: hypothetical protein NTU85_02260 [Candidatus Kaiserbacteria bacterium]|nr:hypothetical protein [Candidatus Kaiserbacteria bacterium]